MKPEQLQGEAKARFETWLALGMSEAAAMAQLYDDGILERDGGETMAAAFRALGLSEAAAEVAVAGRHPAGDMRAPARGGSDSPRRVFEDLQEAYVASGLSRAAARSTAAAVMREVLEASRSAQDPDGEALTILRTSVGLLRLALVGEARGTSAAASPTRPPTPATFINGGASEARGAGRRSSGSSIPLNEHRRRG